MAVLAWPVLSETPTMNTLTQSDQLLRFPASNAAHDISRPTHEKLALEVPPGYDADDGELSTEQLGKIHAAVAQGRAKSVKSGLF